MGWVLLAVFSQIYSENQEQKEELSDVRLGPKGDAYKVGAKDNVVTEQISTKKKPAP